MTLFPLLSILLIGSINGQWPPIPGPPPIGPSLPNCVANEYFTNCYNSCEERKCPVRLIAPPSICPPICVRGCACNDGYVRNIQGRCVREAECPPIDLPTPPPPTCNSIDCRFGQRCENQNGRPVCVAFPPITPPILPPTVCPLNEYSNDCHNSCTERKCPTNEPLPPCAPIPCTRGCSCQNGFVRNEQGRCVREAECPPIVTTTFAPTTTPTTPTCSANEFPNNCHNPCTERRCPISGHLPPTCPPMACIKGCSCQIGYVRNLQGRCTREVNCPPIAEATTPSPTTRPTTPPTTMPPTCADLKCTTKAGCVHAYPAFCPPPGCHSQPQCLEVNPCNTKWCHQNEYCVLVQPICVRAPCSPIAECRARWI